MTPCVSHKDIADRSVTVPGLSVTVTGLDRSAGS